MSTPVTTRGSQGAPAAAEFLLPDVGEGLTEADVVGWKVAVGDTVAVNDVLVEIETAKSLVELPSPYAGQVLALLVAEGDTVPVGTPIIRIGQPGADGAGGAGGAGAAGAPGRTEAIDTNVPPEGNPTLVGYGPREVVARRRPRRGPASAASDAGAATQMQVQGAFAPGGAASDEVVPADEPPVPVEPVGDGAPASSEPAAPSPAALRALAKPPVRKLAKDLGVDLATLTPTGPGGTVTRADVEAAARGPAATPEPAAAPAATRRTGPGDRHEPVTGVRKAMAQAMTASAFTAPHVTEWVTVDVTRTTELVARLAGHRELADVRVTPLLVLARAVVLALRRTPLLNSTYVEGSASGGAEVVVREDVNLGIAAATPRGLVVPNIKGAQHLSLAELGAALGDLVSTARAGRTQPADMAGGTFTITNVGVFGVDGGTPILNPGESGILCFGAVKRQPWVVTAPDGSEELAIRDVATLTLSFDHRHVDGETGSRFLADVAAILEDPATALLF